MHNYRTLQSLVLVYVDKTGELAKKETKNKIVISGIAVFTRTELLLMDQL